MSIAGDKGKRIGMYIGLVIWLIILIGMLNGGMGAISFLASSVIGGLIMLILQVCGWLIGSLMGGFGPTPPAPAMGAERPSSPQEGQSTSGMWLCPDCGKQNPSDLSKCVTCSAEKK